MDDLMMGIYCWSFFFPLWLLRLACALEFSVGLVMDLMI